MDEMWDRQYGESGRAYQAFCTYRDMGVDRSYAAVAQKLGKSKTIIDRWGSRWRWVERVAAYDTYLETEARKTAEDERKKMAKRHAQQAMMFQEKVIKRLQALDPKEIPVSTLIAMFDTAVRVERLSRGESTEHVDHTVNEGITFLEITRNARVPVTDETVEQ